jgi:tRNA-specific 2-thiouridylase
MVGDLHWTGRIPVELGKSCEVEVAIRYRQAPAQAMLTLVDNGSLTLRFKEPVWALAPGQSAVLYQGPECLGGGILLDPSLV